MLRYAEYASFLAALVLVYWMWVRPILKTTPKFAAIYAEEESILAAVKAKFAGIKGKLTAALVVVASSFVSLYDFVQPVVSSVDTSSLTAQVPPQAWPIIMIGITLLLQWFRKLSEKRAA